MWCSMHACMNTESSADGSSAPDGAPNSCARSCTSYGWVRPYICFILFFTIFLLCFLISPKLRDYFLRYHWAKFQLLALSCHGLRVWSGLQHHECLDDGRMDMSDISHGCSRFSRLWRCPARMVLFTHVEHISESLFAHSLSITAASSRPNFDVCSGIDLYTNHGVLGGGLPSQIGEFSPLGHETKVHSSQTIHQSFFMPMFSPLCASWVWCTISSPRSHGNGFHGSIVSPSPSPKRFQGTGHKKCPNWTILVFMLYYLTTLHPWKSPITPWESILFGTCWKFTIELSHYVKELTWPIWKPIPTNS